MYNFGQDPLQAMQKQLDQMRSQASVGLPNTNIVWVQGIEGAKGYQIPNRANILLLDSENEDTMYIVSADDVGMRKMRMFHFTEVEVKQPGQVDMDKYATKDDVRNIILEMLSAKEAATNDEVIQGPCYVTDTPPAPKQRAK